jgi:hypothetical protein
MVLRHQPSGLSPNARMDAHSATCNASGYNRQVAMAQGCCASCSKQGLQFEVTTPDKQDRRRRGKNDDLDAQNAAHAAFAGQRTVTPRSRDGMVESLRVLMACRKTAVSARRVALQMIHNTIVCAPDGLRDQLRSLTRMQLVRTLAARPRSDRVSGRSRPSMWCNFRV